MTLFRDRTHAGKELSGLLTQYADTQKTIVLALPRGGVPVAIEVAQALHLPLDIYLVRKLGIPRQAELAFGAIALGNIIVLDKDMIHAYQLDRKEIASIIAQENKELDRRNCLYRGSKSFKNINGYRVILVDDGIATGMTMQAAIKALKQLKPLELIVATPVAAESTCRLIEKEVDQLVCQHRLKYFHAVGIWYEDFCQISDDQVVKLLKGKLTC